MKTRRRILIGAAAVPVLLLIMLALVPLLFRGRIEGAVQSQIARNVNAEVAWSGVGMSLLRDFPNATLEIRDLSITGVEAFAGDTLLSLERLRTELALGSVWRTLRGRGSLIIRGIDIDRPAVRLITLEDGRTSWQIMEPDTMTAADSRGIAVTLKRLSVRDARVTVDDRQAGLAAEVAGLDHTLSGDFRQQQFTLSSETSADTVSVRFAGIPYLSRASVAIDADVDADMAARKFTLRDNVVRVNGLELRSEGALALAEPGGGTVDLTFAAPGTSFGEILSLIPAVYTQSFASLQTAGTMSVSGRVNGAFGPGAFPAFEIAAQVEDGSFRYPDLPLPARDIALDVALSNPGGSADSTVVRVNRMHVVLGEDSIEASLVLRTPISDPDVDARLAGRLDLEDIGRTMKLENVQELRGIVVADAAMKARQSDVQARRYERVDADGSIELTGVAVSLVEARPVEIDHALLRLTPAHAELSDFRARSGGSDVVATGTIDNLLGYALGRDVLRGQARLTSTQIDLNEWRSEDEARAVPIPENVELDVTAEIARLTFGTLEMNDARGALHVKDRRATLDGFRMNMFGGNMAVTGWYETVDPTQPRFDVDLAVTNFDVPTAFAGLATMRALAPVAEYMRGSVSADLNLAGALGTDLSPVLSVLTGEGSLETRDIVVQDFPAFDRLAERLSVDQLRDPALRDLSSSFEVRDGRVHVRPFDMSVGPLAMTVTGSNGFDQTMDYQLALRVPRELMGTRANDVVASLAAQTQRVGLDLQNAATIGVGVQMTGNVRDPELGLNLQDAAGSTAALIEQSLRQRADSARESAQARADSAAAAARQRAEAEAARIIAEAEERADAIREEARVLSERVQEEAAERADSLVARASNPAARIAARAAADRLRSEAAAQAERIRSEADARATALVDEARRRAATVNADSGGS